MGKYNWIAKVGKKCLGFHKRFYFLKKFLVVSLLLFQIRKYVNRSQ